MESLFPVEATDRLSHCTVRQFGNVDRFLFAEIGKDVNADTLVDGDVGAVTRERTRLVGECQADQRFENAHGVPPCAADSVAPTRSGIKVRSHAAR